MGRKIDFSQELSDEDAQYVAERPWLLDEIAAAAVGDDPEESSAPAKPSRADRKKAAEAEAQAEEEPELEADDADADDEATDDDDDAEADDAVEVDADDEGYFSWNKAQLHEEIRSRNEQYGEAVIVPEGDLKAQLVAALAADDAKADAEADAEAN